LKKAAQKLLLLWAGGGETSTAQGSGQFRAEDGEWAGAREMVLEGDFPQMRIRNVEIALADRKAIGPGKPAGRTHEEVRVQLMRGRIQG
jgi:hypothetical protein